MRSINFFIVCHSLMIQLVLIVALNSVEGASYRYFGELVMYKLL